MIRLIATLTLTAATSMATANTSWFTAGPSVEPGVFEGLGFQLVFDESSRNRFLDQKQK